MLHWSGAVGICGIDAAGGEPVCLSIFIEKIRRIIDEMTTLDQNRDLYPGCEIVRANRFPDMHGVKERTVKVEDGSSESTPPHRFCLLPYRTDPHGCRPHRI